MRVNLASGETLTLDLESEADALQWARIESSPSEQTRIRGITLHNDGTRVAVSAPRRFGAVAISAEVCRNGDGSAVADSLTVQADNARLTVLLYRSGMVRVDLVDTGRPRHLAQFRRRGRNNVT